MNLKLDEIDLLDLHTFKEGIDVESNSYKFYNSRAQFMFLHQKHMIINSMLTKRVDALPLDKYAITLHNNGLRSNSDPMFEKDLNLSNVIQNVSSIDIFVQWK